MITQERLKELLRYDSETGEWVWLVQRTGRARAYGRAGWIDVHRNRRKLSVDGKVYHSNRLIWFYMTGMWPPEHVDHANTDGTDDRWCNLRLATPSENQANRRVFRNNQLGIKGVKRIRGTKRFQARIYANGKPKHLGCFDTPELANAAYRAAAEQLHGSFARG